MVWQSSLNNRIIHATMNSWKNGICLILVIITLFQEGLAYQLDNVSPTSRAEFVKNFINDLDDGKIIYNPPNNMTVNITEMIKMIVTREKISSGEYIKIGSIMRADLKGEAFRVRDINSKEQVVAANGSWNWEVTPRISGTHNLSLVVSVKIPFTESEQVPWEIVKDKTIQVTVNPNEAITNNNVNISFQFLWGLILAMPLVLKILAGILLFILALLTFLNNVLGVDVKSKWHKFIMKFR